MDQEEWMHRYVAYLSHLGWQPYELERMAFNAWESWAEEDPEEIASVEDARSFIAQHYATVIAENERLRTTGARLLEWWPEGSGNSLAGHNKGSGFADDLEAFRQALGAKP